MAKNQTVLPRRLESEVIDALKYARIVAILGPRQAGKSTLVATIKGKSVVAGYATLDEPTALEQAIDDPTGFLANRVTPLAIDEIQRAPELLLALKRCVDADPTPGRFLITGSANLLRMRKVPDLLPGRIDYLRLWPLSQGEIENRQEHFIDTVFEGKVPQVEDAPIGIAQYSERIVAGGFPDAVRRLGRARERWFNGYISSSLPALLDDVSAADPVSVQRTLRAVAAVSGSTINYSALSRILGIDDKSVRAHIEALEQLMIVRRHAPWFTNLLKRQTKSPKIYLIDTGLWSSLLGAGPDRLVADDNLAGRAIETFAVTELVKQAEWSDTRVNLHHMRDRDNREIDIVLEHVTAGWSVSR